MAAQIERKETHCCYFMGHSPISSKAFFIREKERICERGKDLMIHSTNVFLGYMNINNEKGLHFSDLNVFVSKLMCTFRASCRSWAHTPVINWAVCLGQKVTS